MSITEILASTGMGIFLILALIKIVPLEINPWKWLVQKINRFFNKEALERINKLEEEIQEIQKNVIYNKMVGCRIRILEFGDELLHSDESHSKEHFDQILRDIDSYEEFCESHPDFYNNVAKQTIITIKEIYKEKLKSKDFI